MDFTSTLHLGPRQNRFWTTSGSCWALRWDPRQAAKGVHDPWFSSSASFWPLSAVNWAPRPSSNALPGLILVDFKQIWDQLLINIEPILFTDCVVKQQKKNNIWNRTRRTKQWYSGTRNEIIATEIICFVYASRYALTDRLMKHKKSHDRTNCV